KNAYANQQAIGYYTRALNIANRVPEKIEQKLAIFESLGDVYNLVGKPDEALQSYESALDCSDKRRRRADIYRKIASIYARKLQPDLVMKYLDTAIEELDEDSQSVEMARICNVAMDIFTPPCSWANHDKALDYGFKSLNIVDGTGHRRELVDTCNTMAEIFTMNGDYERAIQYAQKALITSQEIGDQFLIGQSRFQIGFAYRNTDWRIAVGHFMESIELIKKAGGLENMIQGYHFLGWTYYRNAKDYESAIKYLKEGIGLDKERKFPINTGHMIVILSMIYRDIGEWDNAIKYAEEALQIGTNVGFSDAFLLLTSCQALIDAYMAKGDMDKAFEYAKECLNYSINLTGITDLDQSLSYTEELYEKLGKGSDFASFCRETMEKNAEKLKGMKLTQWYLEPKELSRQFTQVISSDKFDRCLCPEWQWVNPKGDCSYELNIEIPCLVIHAASGCDLYSGSNLDAPRLMQGFSGDFAIETKMAYAKEKMPTVGGLLIWKDKDNFIRFERGMNGSNEIGLSGNINGKWDHFGRGMLVTDIIYMRIERIGDTLSAYCSSDSENWLTCGEVSFPVDDPIQVGIHAIGSVGNRGGNMATTTRFDYFRVLIF
ncbi:tetratricopeptide repeat protein, partial [Candidatus Poribacteria bacterium]|nr:tetratricopeptide repeat protein [Candidatus Poribacteria bacterium]